MHHLAKTLLEKGFIEHYIKDPTLVNNLRVGLYLIDDLIDSMGY